MQRIIDTHIHAWNFERATYPWLEGNTSILNRTYHIAEIESQRQQVNVVGGVLVQAANNLEDTDWMLEVAASTPWLKGVVGWLPLVDPVKTLQLLDSTYLRNPYFKGVRHLIHDETDPRWLLQAPVLESLQILAAHDLSFDVVGVLPAHIETVLEVASEVPGLRMIFDHLNQPPILTNERFGEWGALMMLAAKQPNFFTKISGLGTTTGKTNGWNAADIKPYVEFVVENFGEDRCLCGGDWPVSLLAGTYRKSWLNYIDVVTQIADVSDHDKIFYKNAEQFYKLADNKSNHGGN